MRWGHWGELESSMAMSLSKEIRTQTCIQRTWCDDKIWGEGGCLQASEESSADCKLVLDSWPLELWEKIVLLLKPALAIWHMMVSRLYICLNHYTGQSKYEVYCMKVQAVHKTHYWSPGHSSVGWVYHAGSPGFDSSHWKSQDSVAHLQSWHLGGDGRKIRRSISNISYISNLRPTWAT